MPHPQTNVTAFDGINVPTRADPTNWNERSEDAWARMKPAGDQMNVLAGQVNVMADAAQASAASAHQDRIDAQQARTDTQAARGGAEQARTDAQAAKTQAEAARDAAQGYAEAMKAVSTTSLVIGAGAKVFLGAGLSAKQFGPNQTLKAVNPANAAQWMVGTVLAYTSNGAASSLTLAVSRVGPAAGGNTVANWSITLSGEDGAQGPTGGVAGGPLEGALWQKKGNDVPSAATPDVWAAGGNFVPMIGIAAITGLTAAPQAGAQVTLLATSAFPITASASLQIKGLAIGSTYTCAPGDEIDVRAETTTLFHVTIRKADGTPTVHNLGALHNLRVFTVSGTFTATKTGWHKISMTGGSGSSAVATAKASEHAGASGSGAGGFASGMRFLVAGQTYILQVGAGGVAVSIVNGSSSDPSRFLDGNSGSASSFMGPGVAPMTAGGGQGGKGAVSGGITLPGGAGGTAEGGDLNVQGGSGGQVTLSAFSVAAAGGGAVGIRGKGMQGGNATASTNQYAAAGGAGVGGKGGNATTSAAGQVARACGGGSAGPAADSENNSQNASFAGINYIGIAGGGDQRTDDNTLDVATGGGGFPGQPGKSGGGGAGSVANAEAGGAAGIFAGSGGTAVRGSSGNLVGSQSGKWGGGCGGVAMTSLGSATELIQGTAGSSGGVWIEF